MVEIFMEIRNRTDYKYVTPMSLRIENFNDRKQLCRNKRSRIYQRKY